MGQTIVFCANTVPLNQNPGTLPSPGMDGLLDLFQPMTFTTVVKTIVNFQVVETPTNLNFLGVWQPQSPQQLALKPEGQRAWQWYTLHAQLGFPLNPDDVVTYQGVQYRVSSKRDYSQYGFLEYEMHQDYSGSGPA